MSLLTAFSDVLLDSSVKSTIVFAAAAIISLTLRRSSAATRHLLWTLAFAIVALLPLLYLVPAQRQIAILPKPPQAPAPIESSFPASIQPTFTEPLSAPISPLPTSAAISIARAPAEYKLTFNIMDIWAVGAAVVALFWLAGIASIWRAILCSRSIPAASACELSDQLRRELGIRRSVRLLFSDSATMPMTWGLFRPCILLPATAAHWPLERLRVVLLHELAHVARMDCATQSPAQLACALYWFNPLAWIAARSQRTERERACDDVVLNRGLNAPIYAEHLLAIARSLSGGGIAGTAGVPMARMSGLRRRVTAILDETTNRKTFGRRFLFTTATGFAFVIAASCSTHMALRALPATTSQTAAAHDTLNLFVIDQATSHPIPGAAVRVDWVKSDIDITRGESEFKSARDGHITIPIPKGDLENLAVRIDLPGYVGMILVWGRSGSIATDPIPATYTLKMEKGTTIRGRVINDSGAAVSGAHVFVQLTHQNPTDSHEEVYEAFKEIRNAPDGIWQFNSAPSQMDHAFIGAWDDRYATEGFFPMKDVTPLSSLRDGTETIVLHDGVQLEGVVRGINAAPLAGAAVTLGDGIAGNNATPAHITDGAGHFSYIIKPNTTVYLTVKADGYAPDLKSIDVSSTKTIADFQLTPGKRLQGKVLGEDGKPVTNAHVEMDTWRACQTLDVDLKTDANGQFSWDHAPPDLITANVRAVGYRNKSGIVISVDSPNIIKMIWPRRIRGTVTDSATGAPVKKFTAIQEMAYKEADPLIPLFSVNPPNSNQPDGKFIYGPGMNYPFGAIRVEADGYLPAVSRRFKYDETDVSLVFNLKRGKGITVKVLQPDGSPAAGAIGSMAFKDHGARIDNEHLSLNDFETRKLTADTNGEIQLMASEEPYKLVAFDPLGVGEATSDDLVKSKTLKLTAWAHIHGRLLTGGESAIGQPISANLFLPSNHDPNKIYITYDVKTETDSEGRFSLEHVPPGKLQIGKQRQDFADGVLTWPLSPQETVNLAPGQTIDLQIGGKGRTVLGKAIAPAELNGRRDWNWSQCQAYIDVPLPQVAMPAEILNASDSEKSKWLQYFYNTDAGKAYIASVRTVMSNRRYQDLQMNFDGTFRADDLAPGNYIFLVTISQAPADNQTQLGTPGFASGQLEFTVPPGPIDQSVTVPPIPMAMASTKPQSGPWRPSP
jgi:beta-lactamase regulating signal transducer with metallopeptidase domain/uncharacterized GH25 family protein